MTQINLKVKLVFNRIDFANHVAYIINRELDLAELKGYSFLEMV